MRLVRFLSVKSPSPELIQYKKTDRKMKGEKNVGVCVCTLTPHLCECVSAKNVVLAGRYVAPGESSRGFVKSPSKTQEIA